jgi:hypothetical protein
MQMGLGCVGELTGVQRGGEQVMQMGLGCINELMG